MKLRNKKTGKIREIRDVLGGGGYVNYNSLAELNEVWEDYEELKKYWYVDAFGNIVQNEITKHYGDEYTDMTEAYEIQKQIGNCFETEEEAEKAVEKLKAWQRLRKAGFEITEWQHVPDMRLDTPSGNFICIKGYIPDVVKNITDLDRLFGGYLFGGEE